MTTPDAALIQRSRELSALGVDIVRTRLGGAASVAYMDWSSGDRRHPRTFGDADVEGIAAVAGRPSDVSGYGRVKLFARKFDIDADGPGPVERLQDSLPISYL